MASTLGAQTTLCDIYSESNGVLCNYTENCTIVRWHRQVRQWLAYHLIALSLCLGSHVQYLILPLHYTITHLWAPLFQNKAGK